ncbi:MAG: nitrile hydratase subunit beta [Hyphomicrobiales bacterium]|nr:nitrile hydratase subunit beta [Hyphomicrobiales bacterium]
MTPERKTLVRDDAGGRAVHDVGGLDFGPIDRSEHDLALWEKRVDAMMILLFAPGRATFRVDAMRRVIEDYGQQCYDRTEYYEKWVRAMRNLLVEQEVVSRAEIEAAMRAVADEARRNGRPVGPLDIPW